jgi:O-antigen/teichoic acid export membrane protein
LIWTLSEVCLFVVVLASGLRSPTVLLAAWGVAGAGAALVMGHRYGIRSVDRQAWRGLLEQRAVVVPLTVEMGAAGVVDFLVAMTLAAVGSAAALGEYRAGALLVAPFNVVLASVILTVVPSGVVMHDVGVDFRPILWQSGVVVLGAVCVLGVAVAAIPRRAGIVLFGEHWGPMRDLLPVWAFAIAAIGFASVGFAGLRILRRLKAAMVLRTGSLPVAVGLVAAGVVIGGPKGAVLGYGVAMLLGGIAALAVFAHTGRGLWRSG